MPKSTRKGLALCVVGSSSTRVRKKPRKHFHGHRSVHLGVAFSLTATSLSVRPVADGDLAAGPSRNADDFAHHVADLGAKLVGFTQLSH